MVRGLESSPDIALETRTADMRPAVLRYAQNIHKQRLDLLTELGVASHEELDAAVRAKPRHFTPHRDKIARLQELSLTIKKILENPREFKPPVEDEFLDKETELRELLGKDYVVGFDAVEKAFTLKDGTKALEISEDERADAMQQLIDKLAEPDVAAFMQHLEADPAERQRWMLVYRTSAQINDTQPVSILGLRDVIDADARKGQNAEKLVFRSSDTDAGWYRTDKAEGEPDAWAARPVQAGWAFVTRTVVDGTTSKKHADQSPVLKKKAKALGLTEGKCRRRTPQEVLYDTLVIYRANGVRLLEQRYDWTEQKTSSGGLVGVGGFGAGGVRVDGDGPGVSGGWGGACLSR